MNPDFERRPRIGRVFALSTSVVLALATLVVAPVCADDAPFITLASTTSTEASGLFEHLLPRFRADGGVEVRVVAVGTGKALRIARNGDADALLVHDRASEERFVEEGYGVARREIMFNDFVIVGPAADPAGVRGFARAADALVRLAESRSPFLSRGDDSGTHKAELRLWQAAGLDPGGASGAWYRETGSGMGKTLNTAAGMGAYTLCDRGTWLAFRNRGDLEVLVEGDAPLLNQYSAIVVDPARHPHVKAELATRFVDWLASPRGQEAIGAFRLAGEVLFRPNAGRARVAAGQASGSGSR